MGTMGGRPQAARRTVLSVLAWASFGARQLRRSRRVSLNHRHRRAEPRLGCPERNTARSTDLRLGRNKGSRLAFVFDGFYDDRFPAEHGEFIAGEFFVRPQFHPRSEPELRRSKYRQWHSFLLTRNRRGDWNHAERECRIQQEFLRLVC